MVSEKNNFLVMLRALSAPSHVLTFRKFAGGDMTLLRFGVRAMYFITNVVALEVVKFREQLPLSP